MAQSGCLVLCTSPLSNYHVQNGGKQLQFGRGKNRYNTPKPDGRFLNLALATMKMLTDIGRKE